MAVVGRVNIQYGVTSYGNGRKRKYRIYCNQLWQWSEEEM